MPQAASASPSAHGDTAAPPPRALVAAYAAAVFGLWAAILTPVILTLALRVADLAPHSKDAALSLVLGTGALCGLVSNLFCGHLSDRTTSRYGMRRPWIVGTALVGTLGLALMGVAPGIPLLTVGWCVAQVGFNGTLAALLAVLPDQVAPQHRGTVSGILGMAQALAAVAGAGLVGVLPDHALPRFLVPGLLALTAGLLFARVLPDRHLAPQDRPPGGIGLLLKELWTSPVRHRDFGWAWISRFAIFMSIASVLNYLVYYLQDHLHLSEDEATRLVALGVATQTVAAMAGSFVFGRLSDRLGRRKIFVALSASLVSAGLLSLAVGEHVAVFLLAQVLIGVGQGTYLAVDLALVTEVLPSGRTAVGKELGIFNIATTLPQTVAPALAPVFLALAGGENYPALFVAGTVFACAGALTILPVRAVR